MVDLRLHFFYVIRKFEVNGLMSGVSDGTGKVWCVCSASSDREQ
jgi:hypothetical protein